MSEVLKPRKELLPHERELVLQGKIQDITHPGASSIWLRASSTEDIPDFIRVYRSMCDTEFSHLLLNGVLPSTQPYQTIVCGDEGRSYCERYLEGKKKVDSFPTTVVEFKAPQALIDKLFQIQSKPEDGVISHGLGDKGGKGLPIFNEGLMKGEITWRIVTIKRKLKKRN